MTEQQPAWVQTQHPQWSQALAFRDNLMLSLIQAGKLRRDASRQDSEKETLEELRQLLHLANSIALQAYPDNLKRYLS